MHNKRIVTLCPGISQAAVQQTLQTMLSEFCGLYNIVVSAAPDQDTVMRFLQVYDYAEHICTNWPEQCDFGNRLAAMVATLEYQDQINFLSFVCAD